MATGKVAEKLAIHGGAPVRTKPFGARWFFDDEDRRQVLEVVDKAVEGGWGAANKVEQFEDAFARLHDVGYACATDSGTGAIHAAVGADQPGARRRDHHHSGHRHRHRARHHPPERDSGLRGLGPGQAQHRPGGRRAADHRPHPRHHRRPPVRQPLRHGRDDGRRPAPQHPGDRGLLSRPLRRVQGPARRHDRRHGLLLAGRQAGHRRRRRDVHLEQRGVDAPQGQGLRPQGLRVRRGPPQLPAGRRPTTPAPRPGTRSWATSTG